MSPLRFRGSKQRKTKGSDSEQCDTAAGPPLGGAASTAASYIYIYIYLYICILGLGND